MKNESITTIEVWSRRATKILSGIGISSAQLDAELILGHTLRKSRPWLHAHGDERLDARTESIANARLALRIDRVPIAYILGHKSFFGRQFKVTTATLIPRPESETMMEMLEALSTSIDTPNPRLVDVGTGSGALGISAKLEYPNFSVGLLDVSLHALNVAKKNASQLDADVELIQSDLLTNYPYTADIVLANLPYVDSSWERSEETRHEPELALLADDNGMRMIKKLLDTAASRVTDTGYLLLEADPVQHHALTVYAEARGFRLVESRHYVLVFQRSLDADS